MKIYRNRHFTRALRSFATESPLDISSLLRKHGAAIGQKLESGEIKLTPDKLARSVTSSISQKQYESAYELYNSLGPKHSHFTPSIAIAAALGASGLKRPRKARKVLKQAGEAVDPRTSLTLLISAHCYADRLQSAEELLVNWLRTFTTNHTATTSMDDAISTIEGDSTESTVERDVLELLEALDGKRNLSYPLTADHKLFLDNLQSSSPTTPRAVVDTDGNGDNSMAGIDDVYKLPGMRVWHAMLYMYSERGSWSRCMAILRFIEKQEMRVLGAVLARQPHGGGGGDEDMDVTDVTVPLRLDNLVYHRTITALVVGKGFFHMYDLFDEMHAKGITPHPRSTAQLLNILSQWDEIRTVNAMMGVVDTVSHLIVQLNNMSDKTFSDLHAINGDAQRRRFLLPIEGSRIAGSGSSNGNGSGVESTQKGSGMLATADAAGAGGAVGGGLVGDDLQETFIEVRVDCDKGYFLELDGGRESRQKALDELITILMKALAPDRGFNVFAEGIDEHLRKHNVSIPTSAVLQRLYGLCRANKWKEGLVLYKQLAGRGEDVKGNGAYDAITDAMLRVRANEDLAKFLVEEN